MLFCCYLVISAKDLQSDDLDLAAIEAIMSRTTNDHQTNKSEFVALQHCYLTLSLSILIMFYHLVHLVL